MLHKVPQAHRPPRQAQAGVPPGKGPKPGEDGQQPFIATDDQRARVMTLVACGFTTESISVIMAIPEATLERHFAWQLKHGKLMVDAKVLSGIVNSAIEGDRTMSIFYAKAKTGWRDVGKDGDQSAAAAFTINISNGSNETTKHEISITALPNTINQED